ncbi:MULTISPECIES: LysM domain-containing protein [unclassified Cryobacterium]|uniref:LysM peptidoglycan-binding domain-containing protein n=1 Tax=unclassified Cryobacterium TaxID=2649013 RepID=UPI002AB34195|nr:MULTISPECIES: LysM domain-containing protein [unclassified Cryobacterium]MDY7527253.1 LysM domain-containing protein [Cryobacterium sp. 10C2]MDY7556962.1 LysM domain-containing protein [Cryobacterium sp. 10C3]MEB0003814.1 LysM domain-containing protein [Cryobacterium sp. RTC2.1]MEB0290285.1 LysM domain-containing protein [Cryobacterium sp. 10C2]
MHTPLKVPAPRPARISWKVLGIALALLVLSGCAAAPIPAPPATPSPTATSHLSKYPTPRDQGPFDGAEGTTTIDSSGKITYTVVSGDSASTIATRFGVYPEQVETLGGGKVGMSAIHPGDKLQFGTRGYT